MAIHDGIPELDLEALERRLYPVPSAEPPYRILVEHLPDGVAILTPEGDVRYGNGRLATLLEAPIERIVGGPIDRFLMPADRAALAAMLRAGEGRREGRLLTEAGRPLPARLSVSTFVAGGVQQLCL